MKVFEIADGDDPLGGVDRYGVARPPLRGRASAQPAALPDRYQLDRVDRADLAPGGVDDATGPKRNAVAEEGGATAEQRQEARVLAVGLGRGAQSGRGSLGAHLGFGHLSDGQQCRGQRVLVQHVQHVGLILGRVAAPT